MTDKMTKEEIGRERPSTFVILHFESLRHDLISTPALSRECTKATLQPSPGVRYLCGPAIVRFLPVQSLSMDGPRHASAQSR